MSICEGFKEVTMPVDFIGPNAVRMRQKIDCGFDQG